MTEPSFFVPIRAIMRPLRPHRSALRGEQAPQTRDSATFSPPAWLAVGKKSWNPANGPESAGHRDHNPESGAACAGPCALLFRHPLSAEASFDQCGELVECHPPADFVVRR